jgi:serine/threonine protein kinase
VKLQEIHNAGILHGDLRLQNLLLDKSGRGTIIDFDQARKETNSAMMERECVQLRQILEETNGPIGV